MRTLIALTLLALFGCSEEVPQQVNMVDSSPSVLIEDVGVDVYIPIIDSSPPPEDATPVIDQSTVTLCEEVTVLSSVGEYCACQPQCCERQEWYCPPRPDQQIHRKSVIVGICDDQHVPCEFGTDQGCPPPAILLDGECELAFECPPGSSNEFSRWFDCELEDGRFGRQRILCDKGRLIHGPCQPCEEELCDNLDNDCDDRTDEGLYPCESECGEGRGICTDGVVTDCSAPTPQEEVCDFEDNDCDDEIDEGQRNACDDCGPVPTEECDGFDNDCDGSVDEDLIRECETPCARGVESCLGGRWASCTARQPVEEECDGFDNDCDGIPDEGINCLCTRDEVGVLFPCAEPPLMCGMGFKTCDCLDVDCELIGMTPCLALCAFLPLEEGQECHPGIGQPINPELCNNFDEDCDDQIDENLSRACYTGPQGTLNIGVCRPGNQTCIEGRWGAPDPGGIWVQEQCGEEVVPSEEICNGADDDCDGEVDYGEEVQDTDILLIVDSSGSMRGEIRAVMTALNRFAQNFAAEEAIHWGLILGPTRAPDPEHPGSELEVLTMVSNIAPFQQFLAAFASVDPDSMDGGLEMLIDAAALALRNLNPPANDFGNRSWVRGVVSNPPIENFIVNWRPDTDRIIIVFSDEDEQSFLNPPIHRNDLARALDGSPRTKLYTFALAFYGWDELADASGGSNFDLSPDAVSMYNDLMTIIDQLCLPRANGAAAASMGQWGYRIVEYKMYDYENMICWSSEVKFLPILEGESGLSSEFIKLALEETSL